MTETLDDVTSAVVETLRTRVESLEQRVAALEARRRPGPAPDQPAADDVEAPQLPALPQGGLALAGRSLLVLAGAYLFRALTDAGALPPRLGVALGLAYAALWQLQADRDARGGRRASAVLHGLTASAIAFSLVWEATARFGLLGGGAAGASVFGFAVLGLAVSWRHDLKASAWLTTLGACATVVAVLASTHRPVTALVTLLALAGVLEWLAFRDAWLGLRWCVAAALDAVAVLLVAIGARAEPPESYAGLQGPEVAIALLALPALYVTSVAARTLRRGCPVKLFEAVQGTLAASLGLVGATRVLAAHGRPSALPALLAMALGALCYAVAFAHAERRPGQGRNFYFYSSAGGLLMLGGTLELGLGAGLPLVWTALGAAAVFLGRRFGRTTLRAHGAGYLLAAALVAGLMSAGARALAGLSPGELSPIWWPVAVGVALAWGALAGERAAAAASARLPRLLLALVTVLALAEAARQATGAAFGSRLAEDAGTEAVVRSAVLVALVLVLAWLVERGQPELVWLVYPLVAVGALKLLLHDARLGRPATLVASLALYGSLLILLPRLLKARERPG
jgi:hypothetical protein